MWCGRGIRLPLNHGWRSGRLTGAESALCTCTQGARPTGLMGVVRVFAHPAEIRPFRCRVARTNLNSRNLLLSEGAIPHSALARGPPESSLALLFCKWICAHLL